MDATPITQHEGRKYLRRIVSAVDNKTSVEVDVYSVIVAYEVTCPAVHHCLKKLLCPGTRGKGTAMEDLIGANAALQRAIELQKARESQEPSAIEQLRERAVMVDAKSHANLQMRNCMPIAYVHEKFEPFHHYAVMRGMETVKMFPDNSQSVVGTVDAEWRRKAEFHAHCINNNLKVPLENT